MVPRLPSLDFFLTAHTDEAATDVQALIREVNANKEKFRESTRIPGSYQLFPAQKEGPKGLLNKLCYQNSLDAAKANAGLRLAIGYLVDKKPNSAGYFGTSPHAWNIDGAGRVHDLTLGKTPRDHYLGRLVTDGELARMRDADDVFDAILAETRPE